MNTVKDLWDYDVVVDGPNEGRYATSEVAQQALFDERESEYRDTYEEAYGYRPRWCIGSSSFDDLEEDICVFDKIASARAVERTQHELLKVNEFQRTIQATIDIGAGDEETALRWLTQDETFYGKQDVESWVYEYGILYTDYGRELVKRLCDGVVKFKQVG